MRRDKRLLAILKALYQAAWRNETYYRPDKIIERAYKKLMKWKND